MRFLLVGLLLAQTVFPPGAPSVRPFPPGSGAVAAPAVCPLSEAYLNTQFINFDCGGEFTFIVCDPKPVFTLYEACMGMVNMGSVTVNYNTNMVVDNTRDGLGGFKNLSYPATTAQLDACYDFLSNWCPS